MNIQSFARDFRKRQIQSKIDSSESALRFWTNVEKDRRENKNNFPDHILFPFIRQAKEHVKAARSDLEYWTNELAKV